MNNPKFEQKINQKIVKPKLQQTSASGYGLILSYDPKTNTATVQAAQRNSSAPGEIFKYVPLPTTIGVQSVAPEPGRHCWIDYQGASSRYYPVITHIFNNAYDIIDYQRQNVSVNNAPRYMLGS